MRLEATLPDSRGDALVKLADELGLTRSQVVDEAVGLFLKAVLEIRRGRRLVTVDAVTPGPLCEMATPTLATLEWTTNAEPRSGYRRQPWPRCKGSWRLRASQVRGCVPQLDATPNMNTPETTPYRLPGWIVAQ